MSDPTERFPFVDLKFDAVDADDIGAHVAQHHGAKGAGSKAGEFDNLEGLAVWRDQYGLRLTLVSDDNGSERLSTEFVEFRVIEE